ADRTTPLNHPATDRIDLLHTQRPTRPRTPRRTHPPQPPRPDRPATAHPRRLHQPQPPTRPAQPRNRQLHRLTRGINHLAQPTGAARTWNRGVSRTAKCPNSTLGWPGSPDHGKRERGTAVSTSQSNGAV